MFTTELDKRRRVYAEQALKHALENEADLAVALIDNLFLEWGAQGYRQGREHMAARIKKCADEWVGATGS